MTIVVVGNFGTGWDGSVCDEEHIAKALEFWGHTVYRLQRDSEARYAKADLTIIAQWDGYTDDLLRTLPRPLVYWAFDYQNGGQEWHEKLVAIADLYLSKPFSDSKYQNWQWLSQDFSPGFLHPKKQAIEGVEQVRDIDVLFTGSWVPWESGEERVRVLKAIDEKFNLQINSVTPDQWKEAGFKNVQGPVMDEGLIDLIARTKVNFSMDHVHARGYWSDRNAQIMMCGGVVLFKHVPMSEAIFKDHVFYFNNVEDCLGRIELLLKMPDVDYNELGYRNYQFALRYMTAQARVGDFLALIAGVL